MATTERELEQLLAVEGLATEGYRVTIGGDGFIQATIYHGGVLIDRKSFSGWRKYQRAARWALRRIDDHRKAKAALGTLSS